MLSRTGAGWDWTMIDPPLTTTVAADMAALNLNASCTAQAPPPLADVFTTDCQYDGFSTALIQSKAVNFGIGQHFEARLNTDGMADKTVASVWFQSDDVEISIVHEENKLTVSAYVFGANSTLSSHVQVIAVPAGGTHTYGVQWQVNNDLVFVFDDDIKATVTAAQWFPAGEDGDKVVRDMPRLTIDVQISDDATEADLTAMESACVADPTTVFGLHVLEAADCWEDKCGQRAGFYKHTFSDSATSMLPAAKDGSYTDIGHPVGFCEPNKTFADGVSSLRQTRGVKTTRPHSDSAIGGNEKACGAACGAPCSAPCGWAPYSVLFARARYSSAPLVSGGQALPANGVDSTLPTNNSGVEHQRTTAGAAPPPPGAWTDPAGPRAASNDNNTDAKEHTAQMLTNGNDAASNDAGQPTLALPVSVAAAAAAQPAPAAAAAAAAQLPADYHGVSAAQEVEADLTIRHRSTSAKGSGLNDGKAGEDVIGGSAPAGVESAGGSGKGVERSVTLFNSYSFLCFLFFFLFPPCCV